MLIERLLWTCPDVGRLLLLMREKRDVPPEKRLAKLKESQVSSRGYADLSGFVVKNGSHTRRFKIRLDIRRFK